MKEKYYIHPRRHSKNVEGPFYSLAELDDEGCHSECLDCELPQSEAPKLIHTLSGDNGDTYFIKQPENEDELEQAITAIEVCCVSALRYAGTNKSIIKRIPANSDYKITFFGKLKLFPCE